MGLQMGFESARTAKHSAVQYVFSTLKEIFNFIFIAYLIRKEENE